MLARRLYAAALLAMPLTYGTKFAIGLPNLLWIDPTLILSLIVLFLIWPKLEPTVTILILLSTLVSAGLGFAFLNVPGSIGGAVYDILREPIRLSLNFILFWITVHFVREDRAFVIKWLSLSVIVQLVIAVYLWLAAAGITILFEPALSYARDYAIRQLIWFGSTPVMRLGGTFMESPPFGLFMFSIFAILTTAIFKDKMQTKWLRFGWLAALIGTIGSLSDQILLAFAMFTMLGISSLITGPKARLVKIFAIVSVLVFSPYMIDRISDKISETTDLKAYNAMGRSGGERVFHLVNSVELLSDSPELIPFGVGPGRYGEYAAKTGVFPDTVTPQVIYTEWLIEHGLVGLFLLCWFSWIIFKRAHSQYHFFGMALVASLFMANSFQGNWKWEAWFVALAFIYASSSNQNNVKHSSGELK